MRALLDVNVLIALLDSQHVHHSVARKWLDAHVEKGWATSPITQLGCIRIMSNPGYPNPNSASVVAAYLGEATTSPHHAFWPDDVSLVAFGDMQWERVLGSRQVTDAHLLALAVRHKGRLVTLDKGIQTASVRKAAAKHLVVIE